MTPTRRRLGFNIDHVATLRQVRRTSYPDLIAAAEAALEGGADGITLHLREDRRHIQDSDVRLLRSWNRLPLNLEMALTQEMLSIATDVAPAQVTLVPERREELTTEGGLNVEALAEPLKDAIKKLDHSGIPVSLFVEPAIPALERCAQIGIKRVELHSGAFANAAGDERDRERDRIQEAASWGRDHGISVHVGHGLTLDNVPHLASIAELEDFNIGHAIVCDAVLMGLGNAVAAMKKAIQP